MHAGLVSVGTGMLTGTPESNLTSITGGTGVPAPATTQIVTSSPAAGGSGMNTSVKAGMNQPPSVVCAI